MKLILASLSLLILATGCSGGSGNNGGGGTSPNDPYGKLNVPPNAASPADVQAFQQKMAVTQSNVPAPVLIFSQVIDGDKVVPVDRNGADYREALSKLSNVGYSFLSTIKNRCQVNNPFVDVRVVEQKPELQVSETSGGMGLGGAGCPFFIKETINGRQEVVVKEINGGKGRDVTVTSTMNSSASHTIADVGVQTMTGLKSRSVVTNMKLGLNIIMTDAGDGNGNGSGDEFGDRAATPQNPTKMDASMEGAMDLQFADGDYLKGPMSMSMTSVGDKMIMNALLDLQTKAGAIRIVMSVENNKTSVYLNGREVPPSSLGDLPMNLTSGFLKGK